MPPSLDDVKELDLINTSKTKVIGSNGFSLEFVMYEDAECKIGNKEYTFWEGFDGESFYAGLGVCEISVSFSYARGVTFLGT